MEVPELREAKRKEKPTYDMDLPKDKAWGSSGPKVNVFWQGQQGFPVAASTTTMNYTTSTAAPSTYYNAAMVTSSPAK